MHLLPNPNISDSSKNWTLNAANWQGPGGYPYRGLGFEASVNYTFGALYEVRIIEKAFQASKRYFYVNFRSSQVQAPLRTYYISGTDECSKTEFNDAISTDVVLYEYASA